MGAQILVTEDEAKTQTLPRKRKLLYTGAMYLSFICLGLAATMRTPARLDIAELTGSSFASVSYGTSIMTVGSLVGSVVTTWVYQKINRHLGMVACFALFALFVLLTPFSHALWLYFAWEFGQGFGAMGVNVVIHAWLLEIWQESANPFMQGLHSCFGIGFALGPLYEEPFLSPDRNETATTGNETGTIPSNETSPGNQETRIYIPYSITTVFLLLVCVMMLVIHFKIPYKDPKRTVNSKKESDNNNLMCEEEDADPIAERKYYLQMITLGSLLLCFYTGLELSTLNFLPEFAHVVGVRMTKSRAAFLASVTSSAYAVNRVISILVATKLKAKTMLYISFAALVVGNTILLIFSNYSEVMMWIGCVIIGAGHSCVMPCIMAFLEERMNVTTTVCSIFLFSSCTANIVTPILIGSYIESFPMIYVYINLIALIVCAVIFAALFVIDRRFRRARKLSHVLQ